MADFCLPVTRGTLLCLLSIAAKPQNQTLADSSCGFDYVIHVKL